MRTERDLPGRSGSMQSFVETLAMYRHLQSAGHSLILEDIFLPDPLSSRPDTSTSLTITTDQNYLTTVHRA